MAEKHCSVEVSVASGGSPIQTETVEFRFSYRYGAPHSIFKNEDGSGSAHFWFLQGRIAVVAAWGRASRGTVHWMLERHDFVRDRCAMQDRRMYLALWYGGLERIDPGTRQMLARWFGQNRKHISRVVAISHDPVVRMAGFTINMLYGNTGRMARSDDEFLEVLDGWVDYLGQQKLAVG